MASQEDALALFTRAKPYLLNPVRKRFYVDNEALPPNLPFAGETALSEYTMLAPPRTTVCAYGGRARDLSGMDTLVDYNEQSQVEVWRYSPTVLSPKDGYVGGNFVINQKSFVMARVIEPAWKVMNNSRLTEARAR